MPLHRESLSVTGAQSFWQTPWFACVAPFAIFALFTYAGPVLSISRAIVYPLKTVIAGAALLYFWNFYREDIRVEFSGLAIVAGIFVYIVWVYIDGWYPLIGTPAGFDPFKEAANGWVYPLIAARLFGAVIVVPVMEEIFWRSFAMRFVAVSNFKSLPLGHFSWYSFLLVSVAFGLEHHEWLPGIVAGVVYAGLLIRSKNLFTPILSHGVTNLLLGIHVLATGQWSLW